MHEEMDLHNPQTPKEDSELQSFQRLSQRLKKEFPKRPIGLVADALYAGQASVEVCQRCDGKYVQVAQILWILTCRGGRQRLYDWAGRATEQGLARAVWEGLRAARRPPDWPPLGQIRFGFS